MKAHGNMPLVPVMGYLLSTFIAATDQENLD